MRRQPRRARRAREHDPQHVGVLVVADQRAEAQQVFARLRREPRAHVRRRVARVALAALEARERVAQLVLEHEGVVLARLDPHQQAVERGDVDADRVEPALERLHERRPGAGERVEHAPPRRDVAAEELLDELRDVLAEIRMQAVDVLRPHALGQVALRPGEVEVEACVELLLRRGHGASSPRLRRAA